MSLTQERLKELLSYDPETGLFTWLVDRYSNKVKGTVAGSDKEGYINIHINSRSYRAHWLVWLYVYGRFPNEIDHINRIKSDNRLCNLRETTRALNARNRSPQKRNTSGCAGVAYVKSTGKWSVSITIDKVYRYLGTYADKEEAIRVRKEAEQKYKFGEHECLNTDLELMS